MVIKRVVLSSLLALGVLGGEVALATSFSFTPLNGIAQVSPGSSIGGILYLDSTTSYSVGQSFFFNVSPYTTFDPNSSNLVLCSSSSSSSGTSSTSIVGFGYSAGSFGSIDLAQDISSGTYFVGAGSCSLPVTFDVSSSAPINTPVYLSLTDPYGVSTTQQIFTISNGIPTSPSVLSSFTAFLPNVQANPLINLGGWIKIYTQYIPYYPSYNYTYPYVVLRVQGSSSTCETVPLYSLNSSNTETDINISTLLLSYPNGCGLSQAQAQAGVPIELDFYNISPNQVLAYAYIGQGGSVKRVPIVQALNSGVGGSFVGFLPSVQGAAGVVDGWIKVYSSVPTTLNISLFTTGQSCTTLQIQPNQVVPIQNSQLLATCGVSPYQAQAGVPLELQFFGASPDQVSVYAYEGSGGSSIRRVPFNIPSGNSINIVPNY